MSTAFWVLAVLFGLVGYGVWGLALSRSFRNFGITAFIVILPFWTLLGPFFVIAWRSAVPDGAYSLFERQTYTIFLNSAYAETIAAYLLFAYAVLAGLSLLRNTRNAEREHNRREMADVMAHFPLGWAAAFAAMGILYQELLARTLTAALSTDSLYAAGQNPLVSSAGLRLLTYLSLATMTLVATGLTVCVVNRSYRNRGGSIGMILTYAGLLALQLRANLTLGDRSFSLLLALFLTASIAYFARRGAGRRMGAKLLAAAGFLLMVYFAIVIGMTRINSAAQYTAQKSLFENMLRPGKVWEYAIGNAVEGEALPAHASLYFILNRGVGAFQTLPFIDNTYVPYAQQVGFNTQQGFTIHLVSGWWMSVGPLAPIAAAAYITIIVWLCLRLSALQIGPLSAPWVFAASAGTLACLAPEALRAGPDGLRGTLTSLLLIPAVSTYVFWVIAYRRSRRSPSREDAAGSPRTGTGSPRRRGARPGGALVAADASGPRTERPQAFHGAERMSRS